MQEELANISQSALGSQQEMLTDVAEQVARLRLRYAHLNSLSLRKALDIPFPVSLTVKMAHDCPSEAFLVFSDT